MRPGALLLGFLLVAPAMAQPRVVFLGEQHTSAADHQAQLEALRELPEQPVLLVAEMFTERADQELAAWNAGEPAALLEGELWQREWGHPYALYDDIFGWARTEKVPLLWLRPDPESTKQVREKGPAAAVARIGEVLIGPASYRDFMAEVARSHAHGEPAQVSETVIDRMFTVQCYWDEFMAWRLADLAQKNPDHVLVVLLGDGHLRPSEGVPWRLARRAPGLKIEVQRASETP